MVRYNIETYKDKSLFLNSILLTVFCQNVNYVLYLKHMTFWKLLSEKSRNSIISWFQLYQNSPLATEDPLDFIKFLNCLKGSDDYRKVCGELSAHYSVLLGLSRAEGNINDNLYYLIKCYHREDNTKCNHSIFSGTVLHVLSKAGNSYLDALCDDIFISLFSEQWEYDNVSFKTLSDRIKIQCDNNVFLAACYQSALLCLMTYYVSIACDLKPDCIDWKFIIKQIRNQNSTGMSEVFESCYINV